MEDFVAGEELASVANGLDVRLFEDWRLHAGTGRVPRLWSEFKY